MDRFLKNVLWRNRPMLSRHFAMLTLAVLSSGVAANAQSTYGTLLGTVSDTAGALVAGANVEAVNEATGAERSVKTDGTGDFRLVNLDPGAYTLTVSSANFTTVKDEHIELPSRETVRADIKLAVKSLQQEVVVTANQEVVSEDLTQSNSLSGTEIGSLALNFRATSSPSPINVAALTPTVNLDPGGNLTFAGQVPTATSFSLDGISVQLVRFGGPTKDLFPSIEGIDEFRVNTAGGSAEYAQPTDLTVVTRSGGNKFHGSAFWFAQRKGWDSTDLIAQQALGANANTYGVAVGGPLWKNHTFFWFDYERDALAQNTLLNEQTFPTAWTKGDFSGVPGLVLIDPYAEAPFPTNNLGAILPINATSGKILPLFFPAPAGPNAASDNIDATGNNLVTVFPGQYTVNGFDGRLDHNFSERHHVYGRVTDKQITSDGTDGGQGDADFNPLLGTYSTTTSLLNVAVSHNWVIGPALVNELRGGWSVMNFNYTYPQAKQGDADIAALGIPGLPGPPVNGLGGVPVFYVGNLIDGQSGGTNDAGHPRINKNDIFEVGDNLTWTRGRFNSKFGGEFRRLYYQDNITFNLGDEYGDYDVSGGYDDLGFPCPPEELKTYGDACAAAQFYLGLLDYAAQAQNGPDGKPYDHHFGFYGQTEYKVTPRFTVDVGLRYELNTPFIDETNQLGNFNYKVPGGQLVVNPKEKINKLWAAAVGNEPFVLNTAPGVGLPSGLRFLDKSNIQPRVGFTWKPMERSDSIFKASIGSYSVPVLGAVLYSLLGVDTSYFGVYAPSEANPILEWGNVFSATPGTGSAYPGYRRANQWDLKDPRVIQWHVEFEQNIGAKTVARASYIGSHAYDLIDSPDLNQVAPNTTGLNDGADSKPMTAAERASILKFPNFDEVLTRANGPEDKYNAMVLEVNRRFAQGLSFTNAYTLAFNKTNALGTAPSSAIAQGGQGDNGGNVQNIYDIRSDIGDAFYDPRHKFLSTVVYDLPFGRGRKYAANITRLEDLALGGWGVNSVFLFHTGNFLTPYFPSSDSDPSGTDPHERSVSQGRPDCMAGVSAYPTHRTISQFFNPAAYTIPASDIGRFGTCGVGILTGPKTTTLSMSAGKNFRIGEGFTLRYEAQFSNLFNIANWGLPVMDVSKSQFGLITASQGSGSQAGPRTIQMSLRLSY